MNDTRRQVAVVGIGCRFPGAEGPDEFWRLLHDGVDATSEVPADRFPIDDFYAPEPATPGRTASRRGAFLDRPGEFDADFFGVPASEAALMDPQQRLLMTVAWEALEDAGLTAQRLAGSRTAVFAGVMNTDYWDLQQSSGVDALTLYSFTGNHQRSMLAGRVSYAFDLRGPSVTVDAACASSLAAIHLACQSLRAGDAVTALAAGVNLVLSPHANVMYSQARMMAPDGRCKFGDASADGFVRAEGAGVVVLKLLDRALADGDRVHAVLLGSAISNDGRSKEPITAPSDAGQRAAMRWAYEDAGVKPSEIDYVEAHGTGTRIDLVELAALGDVLGDGRPADRPVVVGSVKTNIGHAEGAAGIAGFIKTVLCLEQGVIPPNLHFTTPHPQVGWDRLPVVLPTAARPFPDHGRPALAAVSGQGISSTNAHLVLSQAPASDDRPPAADGPVVLPLSARTRAGVLALAAAYRDWLAPGGAGRDLELRDIAFTAGVRRTHHDHRIAVTGAGHDELVEQLAAVLDGTAPVPDGRTLARRYLAGEQVAWHAVADPSARCVSLPAYPWQSRHHWLDRPAPTTPTVGV